MRNSNVPPFSSIFIAAFILFVVGAVGLASVIYFTEPLLAPRWLAYFFLTLLAAGLMLPIVHVFQRRIARSPVAETVLVREALFFAIFVDLLVWLQLARVLNGLLAILMAGGFIVLELLLRMAETALFKPDADADE